MQDWLYFGILITLYDWVNPRAMSLHGHGQLTTGFEDCTFLLLVSPCWKSPMGMGLQLHPADTLLYPTAIIDYYTLDFISTMPPSL